MTRRLANHRQRRRHKAFFWALVLALLGYGLFVGDHRPHHLALLRVEERRAEFRIAELRERNRELAGEHDRLASDAFALESLARAKGMVRPGDLVYRIVPVPPGVRETAAESLAVRAARAAAESLNVASPRPGGIPSTATPPE